MPWKNCRGKTNVSIIFVRDSLPRDIWTYIQCLFYQEFLESKSKFRKNLVENTTIIAHEINKLQLQNLEALIYEKTKKPRINRINFENSDNVLKCFSSFIFFLIFYFSR